jgi:hypothetical protein
MSYPYARTYDEAYLYMELRPCVCGVTEFDKSTSSPLLSSQTCGTCLRRYSFRAKAARPDPRGTMTPVDHVGGSSHAS